MIIHETEWRGTVDCSCGKWWNKYTIILVCPGCGYRPNNFSKGKFQLVSEDNWKWWNPFTVTEWKRVDK